MRSGTLNSMTILSDIGGTYVRFAVYNGAGLEHIRKYEAANFDRFEDALDHYMDDVGVSDKQSLRIATAAYLDGEIWRFVNNNTWEINPHALEKFGWILECIINDFEAATKGLLVIDEGDVQCLREASARPGFTRCLMGPGTGLGLGYLIPTEDSKGHHVQKTHGGHMPLACMTDEQWLVSQTIGQASRRSVVPVFEDVVSGQGLLNIYAALCLIDGVEPIAQSAEEILSAEDSRLKFDTLRLFHEFFGLFAAHCMITGHAYGGLYLTGGVLDRMIEASLFDFKVFEAAMNLGFAQSVKSDLSSGPIFHVKEPYLALRGLTLEHSHA